MVAKVARAGPQMRLSDDQGLLSMGLYRNQVLPPRVER
jgi:hypothetical protein